MPISKSISGKVLTIKPAAALTRGVKYKLIIHTGCVTDLSGNKVALKTSVFTVDSKASSVKTINPANNKTIKVTFSEAVKAGNNYVELKGSNGKTVKCTLTVSGSVLTIKPTTTLSKGVKYTLILHTDCVTDLSGNKMALRTSTFTVKK